MDRTNISGIIKNLVVFSGLREEPLISRLAELLALPLEDREGAYALCCDMARELYPHGDSLTERVFELISYNDNFYIKSVAKGEKVSKSAETRAVLELEALSRAAALSSEYFSKLFKLPAEPPAWRAESRDFASDYYRRLSSAAGEGWGDFARYGVFTLDDQGQPRPVRNPDPRELSELFGYEEEREKVMSNTQALLRGLPAANVLLYGDGGTGKSSTVKAIARALRPQGLRLIQVEKSLLRHIPALLDELAENPLKFIIFIDDLSFEGSDRDFTALKTVLEGSVAARAKNTVIYATSNRRHLIRESRQAREGDDIHLRDTLEETASLSARFGLVVTFSRPDREEYMELVRRLAGEYGIDFDEALFAEAEAWAIRAGGRTPRAARQFIERKAALALDTSMDYLAGITDDETPYPRADRE